MYFKSCCACLSGKLRDRVCNYKSPLIDHCRFTLKDYFYLRHVVANARTWMTRKLYYPINVRFYSTFPSRRIFAKIRNFWRDIYVAWTMYRVFRARRDEKKDRERKMLNRGRDACYETTTRENPVRRDEERRREEKRGKKRRREERRGEEKGEE